MTQTIILTLLHKFQSSPQSKVQSPFVVTHNLSTHNTGNSIMGASFCSIYTHYILWLYFFQPDTSLSSAVSSRCYFHILYSLYWSPSFSSTVWFQVLNYDEKVVKHVVVNNLQQNKSSLLHVYSYVIFIVHNISWQFT